MRNVCQRTLDFQGHFWHGFHRPISSTQNAYTHQKDFNNIYTSQIAFKNSFAREKILFSLAVLQISPKNQIKAAVKVENHDLTLEKLDVMLNEPLRIYKHYQVVF